MNNNNYHIPTDAEWTQLTDYLIGAYPDITSDNVGDVLKSTRQVDSPYTILSNTFTANILTLNLLFTQTFDDIGILNNIIEEWIPKKTYYYGESVLYNGHSYKCYSTTSNSTVFSLDDWENNFQNTHTGTTTSYIGESKIDEFRRPTKTTNDRDLYNPIENSGFTQEIKDVYGNINKIISESINPNGSKQNLYEYVLGASPDDLLNSGIHYNDLSNGLSQTTYMTSGLTTDNSILSPIIKKEYLIGVIDEPKINIDVFIDRGVNSTYDRNLKLSEIRTLDGLMEYGNGFFKIKDN